MLAATQSYDLGINDVCKAVVHARQHQRSVINPPSVNTSSNISQTLVPIHHDYMHWAATRLIGKRHNR
mgnify:CR=1 FL=1